MGGTSASWLVLLRGREYVLVLLCGVRGWKAWVWWAGLARCWVLRERAPIVVVGGFVLSGSLLRRTASRAVRMVSGWVGGRRRVGVAGSVRSLRTA
jgi:hypothetical protein